MQLNLKSAQSGTISPRLPGSEVKEMRRSGDQTNKSASYDLISSQLFSRPVDGQIRVKLTNSDVPLAWACLQSEGLPL